MKELKLQPDEHAFLSTHCPYLKKDYLEYLCEFRFYPKDQVIAEFVREKSSPGEISDKDLGSIKLEINGVWSEIILYEVPILSIISEAFYRFVDTDWNMDGQREKIREKALELIKSGCIFSEFGTRRRRSYETQDMVVKELAKISHRDNKTEMSKESGANMFSIEQNQVEGRFAGTSNVYLGKKYGIPVSGTVGHEWTMGIAALEKTFEKGNSLALEKWYQTFRGNLGIALTDTFGIHAFFTNFNDELSSKYNGLRHDSGDPYKFVDTAIAHYSGMKMDPSTKTIVFSDGLDTDKAISLKKYCESKNVKCAFGIGTFLTNDFTRASDSNIVSEPTKIVIKLVECGGFGCVKLSDDPGKFTGLNEDIDRARKELGY
ncbi:putative nicotinate phosphoribosyltransferase [Zancudomyces culisetae]|uniref:Nicotinate phosphoribosyltransferase n=1 Tax=Zancudomyces culisetae TaxID=1213189 RepID=A0A1R1PF04_ZANCU|nr:putative nicotinate phosphoribosyltransferase [Zancudomyces culisetae]|eukprot:OMH79536.1 putative nicotinate phosphoribosyltransferase [Zancudomyces culisetae]